MSSHPLLGYLMADFRRYNSKREIIKLDLVQSEDYTDNVIVCVPKFAYDVARSLIAHYGKWRTTYAVSYQDLHYQIPDDAEFDIIEASLDQFLGSRDMSCDIEQGLECICNAVNELVAASYAGNVGSNYLPASDVAPSEFEDDGFDFPAEFSTRAEFEQHKCNAANTIFQDVLTDYNTLATVDIIGLTGALALAPLLVTGIPGVLLLTGYVILTTSLVVGTAFFLEVVDALETQENEIICAMVNSTTVQEAKNGFMNALYGYPDWSSPLVPGTVGTLADVWLNYTNMNFLFATDPDREMLTGQDCTSCSEGECAQVYIGTGIKQAESLGSITALSVLSYDCYRVNLNFNYNYPAYCGSTVTVTAVVPSQTPGSCSGEPIYRCFNQSGAVIYSSSTPPSSVSGVGWLAIVGSQPIQYQVQWTDDIVN